MCGFGWIRLLLLLPFCKRFRKGHNNFQRPAWCLLQNILHDALKLMRKHLFCLTELLHPHLHRTIINAVTVDFGCITNGNVKCGGICVAVVILHADPSGVCRDVVYVERIVDTIVGGGKTSTCLDSIAVGAVGNLCEVVVDGGLFSDNVALVCSVLHNAFTGKVLGVVEIVAVCFVVNRHKTARRNCRGCDSSGGGDPDCCWLRTCTSRRLRNSACSGDDTGGRNDHGLDSLRIHRLSGSDVNGLGCVRSLYT